MSRRPARVVRDRAVHRGLAALTATAAIGVPAVLAGLAPASAGGVAGGDGRLWFGEGYVGDVAWSDATGGTVHLLTAGYGAAVSPDGTQLLYDTGDGALHLVDADGTGDRVVLDDAVQAAWAPSGAAFTFVRDDDVWSADLSRTGAASGVVDLTNTPGVGETVPAWSPDGSTIAYTSDGCTSTDHGGTCVWAMDADGSDPRDLTPESDFDCGAGPFAQDVVSARPAWSPDGSRIAFRGAAGCLTGAGGTDIWSMAADGSGKTDLTPDADSADDYPVWSPDGATIAFLSDRADPDGGTDSLFTVPADGSSTPVQLPQTFPHTPDHPSDPDWAVAVTARSTRLALAPSTTSVRTGRADTMRLTLTPGAPYAGQTLLVQQQRPGSSAWTTVARPRTGLTGTASTTVHPQQTLRYRAVYAGSAPIGLRASTSPTTRVTVRAH